MDTNPSNVFNATSAPVNYAAVAKTVAEMNVRALTTDQLEDVLTIVEWTQAQCVAQHLANEKRSAELDAREKELVKREREVRIRGRAVGIAHEMKGGIFKRYFRR